MSDPTNADDLILRTIKEEAERHAEDAAGRHAERLQRRRIDWDVRGIIAILALIGTFTLAGAQLLLGHSADIPAWAAALVATVTTYYFVSRGSNGQTRRKDDA